MALIIEDGSIVLGADSFVSLADARALALNYGWQLPADDTEAEQALRNGAKYISLYERRFSGSRVSVNQSLSWPRKDAQNAYGFDIAQVSIPNDVKCAQVAAAFEYGQGIDVRASNNGLSIASEEVAGAVKQSYHNNGKRGNTIALTKVTDCLQSLLVRSSGAFSFNVTRG